MRFRFSVLTPEGLRDQIPQADTVVAYDLTQDGTFDHGTLRRLWGSSRVGSNTPPGQPAPVIKGLEIGVRPGTPDFDELRRAVQEVHGFDDLQKRPRSFRFPFIGGSLGIGASVVNPTHSVELQPPNHAPPNPYLYKRPDGAVEEYSFRRINDADTYFYEGTTNDS